MKRLGIVAASLLLTTGIASADTISPMIIDGVSVTAKFSPNIVASGQSTTFTWSAMSGSFCEVEGLPGGTRYGRSGSYTFAAQDSLTAVVSCENADKFGSRSANLTVSNAAPSVTTSFLPSTVYVNGAGSTFRWSSTLASTCSSPQNSSISGTSGSISVPSSTAPSSKSITVNCSGPNGSGTSSSALSIIASPPPPPVVWAYASPAFMTGPGYVSIWHTAQNADVCVGDGSFYVTWSGMFAVTCWGPGGNATGWVFVNVPITYGTGSVASTSAASKGGRPAVLKRGGPVDLKHLDIDLSKQRFVHVEAEMNNDGMPDLLVLDRAKAQVHLVLSESGKYTAIAKTVENINAIEQVKGVFVPKSGNRGEIRMTIEQKQ